MPAKTAKPNRLSPVGIYTCNTSDIQVYAYTKSEARAQFKMMVFQGHIPPKTEIILVRRLEIPQ